MEIVVREKSAIKGILKQMSYVLRM